MIRDAPLLPEEWICEATSANDAPKDVELLPPPRKPN